MRVRTWAIGLFLILGFAFFTAILFLIGDRQKAFSRHITLYTEFINVSGLAEGAKVRVSGLDGGKVKKIQVPRDASGRFRLELELEEKLHPMLRADSVVSVETQGVVGDVIASIKKGSEKAPEVKAGATLPSKEPVEFSELLERGSGLLNDVHGGIKDIQGRVDVALDTVTGTVNHVNRVVGGVEPNINRIASDGTRITGQVNTLVEDLNSGKGPAGLLLKDEGTRRQMQDTLQHVQQTSANVDQTSERLNRTMTDFERRQLPEKTDATLNHVQSVSAQLDSTMQQALNKDDMGDDGGTNLRQTLSNLDRSTSNLAEDSEALKHNFFFRGFFRKRGFYNLDQLTPADYNEACGKEKGTPPRLWLEGTPMFAGDVPGREELTANGRQQIDLAVAPVVDTLPQNVVVVEGYAQTGSADQQYLRSRQRADLVRRYLESHYHLRHSDLGIVALRATPPPGAGRDRWDGTAIHLIKIKK